MIPTRPRSPHIAIYFGLRVEVLQQLGHCSLIRYEDYEVIVDTQDLVTLASA